MNKESLVDKAYEIIEDRIVTLKLEPGKIISEKQISEEVGIGRMPVREALKKLETAHLIKIMPRRGMMVTEIKLEEVFQQIELRRAIEGIVMRDAAKNATEKMRKRFLELSVEFEEVTKNNDSENAVKIDNEFNLLAAEASKNLFVQEAIRPLHALARRLYYVNYQNDKETIEQINVGHCELMKLIASGDSKNAKLKSDELIDNIEKLYRNSYLKNLM